MHLPPLAPAPPLPEEEPGVEFLLALGKALHRYGTNAYRLEELMRLVSQQLGLEARFFSTPTALFASFGPAAALRTCMIRLEPGDLDLERLALLDIVAEKVLREQLPLSEAAQQVQGILEGTPRYGPRIILLCFIVAAGAGARLFGGSWRESVVAAAASLFIGWLDIVGRRSSAVERVHAPVSAIIASALAVLAGGVLTPFSAKIATVAGLIVLLPGLSLTVAMTELATRNLISGTSRLFGTALVFLQLGFGVALGAKLAALLPLPLQEAPSLPTPSAWTLTPALAGVLLSVSVLLRARPKDFGWIALTGTLAYFGARYGAVLFGQELGAFTGALLVGMMSNALARLRNRPSIITMLPGIMLLVPGSVGFRSMESLLRRDVLSGVDTAFSMLLVAVSLAAGLLLANAVVPPRKVL